MKSPVIIAHRTSPAYAPENSLSGIRVSFEQGAEGVEIDLRASLDQGLFLMHDNSMRRTTGWPLPIELTPSGIVRRQQLRPFATPANEAGGTEGVSAMRDESRSYREGGGTEGVSAMRDESRSYREGGGTEGVSAMRDESRSYRERGDTEGAATLRDESRSYGRGPRDAVWERVPTLVDAIEAVPEGKLLAVDVKTPWSIFGLAREIKGRGMESRTLVWCSSALVVRYAVSRMPGVEVAYYKDFEDGPNNIEFIGRAGRIGAHAVSLDWRGINADVVAAAHSLGLKVYSWHKEHPITAEKIASGLDGVITDHPGRARKEIGRL